jgi:predicted ATP-dependent endonuclease of OLD family
MDVLGNENSLFLFDEPESHLHISRKKEVKKYLDKPNHFSLLTTHSPCFTTQHQGRKRENFK